MTGLEHYRPRKHLSINSLTNFARCPRRFFYNSGCGLVGGSISAMVFGEAMHSALPSAYLGQIGVAHDKFQRIWNLGVAESRAFEDDKRNNERALAMIENFAETHLPGQAIYDLLEPPGGLKPPQGLETGSNWEIPFAIDIGLDVPLVGRIDGLARHRDSKEIYALEWKTTSEMSSRFFEGFGLSPQLLCYSLVLAASGLEPRGAILEALRVSPSNAETMALPIEIEPWKHIEFLKWAQFHGKLLLECERLGEFPRHFSGCSTYSMFGQVGYTCDYKSLCSFEDWTTMRATMETRPEKEFIIGSAKAISLPQLGVSL